LRPQFPSARWSKPAIARTQRPGIVHNLYDWSDDMEFLEIIAPANSATTEIASAAVRTPAKA
jgi:hypothetical protein